MRFYLYLAGCGLLWFGSLLRADESSATISIQLPPAFPLDVQTVIAAELDRPSDDAQVYQLGDSPLGPQRLIAQRELGTNRVWLVARVQDKQLLGTRTAVRAQARSMAPRITIERRPAGLQFLDQGQEVMFYQRDPASREGEYTRANYVHPLRGLDGEVLTEAFPPDHRHHHGVFWAWHQLWVGEVKVGDPWVTADFLAVVRQAEVVEQGPLFATLRIIADWTSPRIQDENGRAQPILQERTQIRLFRRAGDLRWIDFEIELKPLLAGVKIGGAENERGYSGFTVRLKPPAEMAIHDASGRQSEDLVGGASRWVDVSGAFVSGAFVSGGPVSGLGILSHRSLPEFPPRWLLRHYGMQNAVYPGREPILLSAKRPLILRHRLLVHRGDAAQAQVSAQQQAYQDLP